MNPASEILSLLDASNARANAATEGPWLRDDHAVPGELSIVDRPTYCIVVSTATNENSRDMDGQKSQQRADIEFLKASRTELPRANEAIAELVKEESINGMDPYEYILSQFPATEGHIPLRQYFERQKERLTRTLAILKGE